MSPDVERLMGRLAETPTIFLSPVGVRGALGPDKVQIDAVVADLFRERAARPLEPSEVKRFELSSDTKEGRRHKQLVLVATWLLHDLSFAGSSAERLIELLDGKLGALSALVLPRAFVEDAERREELVRTCLAAIGVVPSGETAAAAEDRLATLDSVRRQELLASARAREEERAAKRRELERLRAQEEEEARKAARTTFED
jgi:hypothetical protein